MTEPRLFTEKEAAEYLGLPAASVRKLSFGHVRLGTRHRYDRKVLDADVPLSFHPAATRALGLVTPRSVG